MAAWCPSFTGIPKSMRIRLGLNFSAQAMASSPSFASSTELLNFSSASFSMFAASVLSSAIKIRKFFWILNSSFCSFFGAGASIVGSSMETSSPFPIPSLFALIVPLCISISILEIESPSPSPLCIPGFSTWTNISKMCDSFCFSTPRPSSFMRIKTFFPSREAVRIILLSLGVNF